MIPKSDVRILHACKGRSTDGHSEAYDGGAPGFNRAELYYCRTGIYLHMSEAEERNR